MSPNAGRRYTKIVAPIAPNREQEIVGGLQNALARGETLEKAKQSFINAGYKQEEVNMAAQKFPATTTPAQPAVATPASTTTPAQPAVTIPGQPKQMSKKLLIILIVSGALALIAAGLLGIFWDSIFG